ncbi:HigA family addiction module antitoxin [Bradyrhizobium sp.]|uniref:HigA family addiction module antitoxin n=1 Tax=Bradyrhizobium sp. TaxID=376 RepID=UPI0025BE1336|nr:HigA family addiction module antitoxin [Bradyrhizobium sp.]
MTSLPARRRKVAPLHPGAVAADVLEDNGVNANKAAIAMGMSRQHLGKVLAGKGPVTPDTALRFAAYFGNTAEHWLRMQADHDLWQARTQIGKALSAIAPLKDRAA